MHDAVVFRTSFYLLLSCGRKNILIGPLWSPLGRHFLICVSSSIRLLTLSLVDIICTQTFAFPLVHLGLWRRMSGQIQPERTPLRRVVKPLLVNNNNNNNSHLFVYIVSLLNKVKTDNCTENGAFIYRYDFLSKVSDRDRPFDQRRSLSRTAFV